MKPNNQRGWGLTETLLTLGAMSAMALAIYAVLGPASSSAQVKREQDNLRSLSGAVDKSFGLLGNFSGVSTARILDDGLAPTRMRSGGDLRTAWGTGVGVHPYAVDGVAGNAFLVSYPLAPSAVCAGLASAMSRDAYDIRVEGRSVYAGGRLDPAMAAEQCGATAAASMEFVFFSGLVSGQAVAAAPVVLPPPPPTIAPPPGAPPIITIPGTPEVDPVNPGTPAVPPPAAPPPVLPPPVAPPGTPPGIAPPPPTLNPPPPPVSPPGSMCAPRTDNLGPQSRRVSCPAGQLGDVHQQRTGSQAFTCPEAWGAPVAGPEVWGSWAETSRTCAPACSAPAPSSVAISRAAPAQTRNTCPAGYTGSTPQIRTGTEAGTRTTSWACPAPTGAPTSTTADTWSGSYTYGAWTANGPDTCAPACSAPSPSSVAISRPASNENRTVACPAGQVGTHSQTRTRAERGTRTTSWTCPGPTSSTSDAWSGTYTYGAWTTTSNTCAPSGPPAGTKLVVCYGYSDWDEACSVAVMATNVPGAVLLSLSGSFPYETATFSVPTSVCASGLADAYSLPGMGEITCR